MTKASADVYRQPGKAGRCSGVLTPEGGCPFLRPLYHQWYSRLSEDDSLAAGALGGTQSLLFLGDTLPGPVPARAQSSWWTH